jgi:hypothetical protein
MDDNGQRKSTLDTSSTLQQAHISFHIGNEMEKDVLPRINVTFLERVPEISLVILSDFLV